MTSMALGRYLPLNSPIHRLDARIKIIGMIVLICATFLTFGSVATNFIVYGLLAVLLVVLMFLGKVSFRGIFRALKAMWLMIIFLFVLNILLPGTGDYFKIWDFKIYYDAIYRTLYIIVRLLLVVSITSILTSTTKPLDLTNGLEWLMTPLKFIKVPVYEIAMVISLALRFIPTLMEETDRIMKAQASRGVDFREGKLKEKVRAIISLIIPLFISSFQRSGELADAMESRAYDPDAKRTKYRELHWHLGDTISLISVVVILGLLITMAVMHVDLISLVASLWN